jgi:hypothetical protein
MSVYKTVRKETGQIANLYVFAERIIIVGCSLAQGLVRWAAVRQPPVRFSPGNPPLAQQDELYPDAGVYTQTQEFIPSSG